MKKQLRHSLLFTLFLVAAAVCASAKTSPDCLYVVGEPIYGDYDIWKVPEPTAANVETYQPFALQETAPGSGIYQGWFMPEYRRSTMLVPFKKFRICTALGNEVFDGKKNAIGAGAIYDSPVALQFDADGLDRMSYVASEDDGISSGVSAFDLGDNEVECLSITVDTNKHTVLIDDMSHFYLVGSISGDVPPTYDNIEYYRDYELDVIHSRGKYYAVEDIPAGKFDFYICRGLSGAEYAKIGPSEDVEVAFEDNGYCDTGKPSCSFSSGVVAGSWNCKSWDGGRVAFCVYQGNETYVFHDIKSIHKIWLCDNYSLGEYDASKRLTEVEPGIFKGSFDIAAGATKLFNFHTVDNPETGDDAVWIACLGEGCPLLFDDKGEMPYTVPMAMSRGECVYTYNWKGGVISVTLNLNDFTLSMSTDPANVTKYIYPMGCYDIEDAPVPANFREYNESWSRAIYETMAGGIYEGEFRVRYNSAFKVNFMTAFNELGWDNMAICPLSGNEEIDFGRTGMATVPYTMKPWREAGYWTVPGEWPGYGVGVSVSEATREVTFEVPELRRVIYLVGMPNGWATPAEYNAAAFDDWQLTKVGDSNLYTGVFSIPQGEATFRFYASLDGWDGASWGIREDDNMYACMMVDGMYDGSIVKGKGSYSFPEWPGGLMYMTVDLNNGKVKFSDAAHAELEPTIVATSDVVIAGVGHVTVTLAQPRQVTVFNTVGMLVKSLELPAGTNEIPLAPGFYIVNGHKVIVR